MTIQRAATVLFVCQHGSAKSVVAAAHLRRLAAARGLSIDATSAGLEPDDAVPPHVVAGLSDDGLDHGADSPRQATADVLRSASYVVSFGCDLTALAASRPFIIWDGIPPVSDGYGPARDAIVAQLRPLLDAIVADLALP